MAITRRQINLVAKDRAADELQEILNDAHGFWNIKGSNKTRLKEIAKFLVMDDSAELTQQTADKLGFINGEESLFWENQ